MTATAVEFVDGTEQNFFDIMATKTLFAMRKSGPYHTIPPITEIVNANICSGTTRLSLARNQ
jgi:hypothetical protein